MFERSIIIAAHPDDEILWFSSIIDQVDRVVVCFLENESEPLRGPGRTRSLMSHPVKTISCLGLKEAGVFDKADWRNPVITESGVEIPGGKISERYRSNYHSLKRLLRDRLRDFSTVFTHNPWGEYGHEEHVQLYRVLKDLQGEMGFVIWYSNYCSNRSIPLMLRYISGFDSSYVTMKTNKGVAHDAKELYQKNGCWTWFDDWEWFNEESFMIQRDNDGEVKPYGHMFPVNMIKFRYPGEEDRGVQPSLSSYALRMLKGRIRRRMAMRSA